MKHSLSGTSPTADSLNAAQTRLSKAAPGALEAHLLRPAAQRARGRRNRGAPRARRMCRRGLTWRRPVQRIAREPRNCLVAVLVVAHVRSMCPSPRLAVIPISGAAHHCEDSCSRRQRTRARRWTDRLHDHRLAPAGTCARDAGGGRSLSTCGGIVRARASQAYHRSHTGAGAHTLCPRRAQLIEGLAQQGRLVATAVVAPCCRAASRESVKEAPSAWRMQTSTGHRPSMRAGWTSATILRGHCVNSEAGSTHLEGHRATSLAPRPNAPPRTSGSISSPLAPAKVVARDIAQKCSTSEGLTRDDRV